MFSKISTMFQVCSGCDDPTTVQRTEQSHWVVLGFAFRFLGHLANGGAISVER